MYYLMSYAFKAIDIREFKKLGSENFSNMDDLLAEILLIGVESQRRRGFEREYQPVEESGWRIKGRIDLRRTMRLALSGKQEAHFVYDDYNANTPLNRILKTGIFTLLKSDDVDDTRRKRLRGAISYLQNVDLVRNPASIRWDSIRYHRNNRSYMFLIHVCSLIIKRRLLNQVDGDSQFAVFDDKEAFSALFEAFILNYYKKHYPQLNPRGQKEIAPDPTAPSYVPSMKTDVCLTHDGKTLVLDAKCYGRIFSMRYENEKLSSEHIRQIYYYANHLGTAEDVCAMLIYAGTGEAEIMQTWKDQGYSIGCTTLSLNQEFDKISHTLDAIPEQVFGSLTKRR